MLDTKWPKAEMDKGAEQAPRAFSARPGVVGDERLPCQSHDPELFFPDTPGAAEHAKSLCLSCPIRNECLAGALERGEPWGVWGGELVIRGVVVPRMRPRGRPRKTVAAA